MSNGSAQESGPTGPPAAAVFSAVRRRVLGMHPGDEEGRMLRAPALRTAGSCYAFASADDIMVKLPASRVRELVDGGEGTPCETRPGRPMKEWVCIPEPGDESALAYLLEARAFVAGSGGRGEP